MKKSKILAISLGTVSLATLTIVSPLIITSCNNNEKYANITVDELSLNMVQEWIDEYTSNPIETIIKNNNLDIKYDIKPTTYISFSIKNTIKDVISANDIEKYKLSPNDKISWNINGGWISVGGPENQQEFAKQDLKNGDKFELIGTINKDLKIKINVNISQSNK